MTHRGELKRLAERAIAALGQVDILINNAGGNVPQPIDQITDEIWDHFVELNLSSCMALTRGPGSADERPEVGPRHSHLVNYGLHFDPRAQRLLRNQQRPLGLGPRVCPGSGPVWHHGQQHRTRTLLNRADTDEFHGRNAPEICRSDGVGPLWQPSTSWPGRCYYWPARRAATSRVPARLSTGARS
jgi:short chain dehydrogenase